MQYCTVHPKHCFSYYTTHIYHKLSSLPSCLGLSNSTPAIQAVSQNDFILSQDNHSDITDIIWLSQMFGPSQGMEDVILLSLQAV